MKIKKLHTQPKQPSNCRDRVTKLFALSCGSIQFRRILLFLLDFYVCSVCSRVWLSKINAFGFPISQDSNFPFLCATWRCLKYRGVDRRPTWNFQIFSWYLSRTKLHKNFHISNSRLSSGCPLQFLCAAFRTKFSIFKVRKLFESSLTIKSSFFAFQKFEIFLLYLHKVCFKSSHKGIFTVAFLCVFLK